MKKFLLVCFLSSLTIISWSQKRPKNIIQKTQLAEVKILSPKPIDPQLVQDQDSMTWNDYKPIPGKNWADPTLVPVRKFKMALVAVDFPDQPFVITLPKKSDLFGNPQIVPY